MKTTKLKRLISVVCIIALCFTMVIPAYAVGEDGNGNSKTSQTIIVEDFGVKTYGDENFRVVVTPDEVSGLSDFTYESSNPQIAEISDDGTVIIKAAGETYITVKQAGNDNFQAAEVTRKLVVAKKNVSIASLNLDEKTAVLEGILPEDADKVSLDFDKITLKKFIDSDDPIVLDGCVKFRGVVTENSVTALGTYKIIDTTSAPTIKVEVFDDYDTGLTDGTSGEIHRFLVGDTDAESYLGMSVIGYAKETESGYEIVKIDADPDRNAELVINLDAYVYYDAADGEIGYYKDGANTTSAAKVVGATAIFNNTGMSLASALGNIVLFSGGNITLIDNNDIAGYDVVIVRQAQTGVVEEVTSTAITFINGLSKINLNVDETKVVKVIRDGEVIDPGELSSGDVLSVYWVNRNSDYIVAEVVDTIIEGKVSSVKSSYTSASGIAYRIGGNWYDMANSVYDEGIDTDSEGKFYIDEFGKIVAFVEKPSDYAYVNGIRVEQAEFGSAGNFEVKVQLITADGVEVFKLKSNVKINDCSDIVYTLDIDNWVGTINAGAFTPAADDFYTHTTTTEYTAVVALANTVVKYVKNSSGYITVITAADFNKATTQADFSTSAISGAVEYDEENMRFIGSYGGYIEADTKVFVTAADAKNCYLTTLDELEDRNNYTILASYRDKKADFTNIIVVSYFDMIVPGKKSSMAVVTEVGGGTNDDGESIWTLGYFQDGEFIYADTTADVATGIMPTAGDIVKVKLGSDGIIKDLDMVWDFASNIRRVSGFDGTTADYVQPTANSWLLGANSVVGQAFYGGVVTNFAKNSKLATVEGKEIKLTAAQNIYVVDATGRKLNIDTGSAGDFTYHDLLYGPATVDIRDENGDTIEIFPSGTFNNIPTAVAQNYADWIFARFYEDRPVDIVIVKGAPITIEEGTSGYATTYALPDETETAEEVDESPADFDAVEIDYGPLTVLSESGNVDIPSAGGGASGGTGSASGNSGGSVVNPTAESIRIVASNLTLKGEKAENYTLTQESYDECSILLSNIVTVEVYAEGGNGMVTGAGDYIKGSVVTIAAMNSVNSVFEGWYLGSQCISTSLSCEIIADSDKVIVAKFSERPPYIDGTTPVLTVESVKARAGKTVDVAIEIKNNPGIAGLQLKLFYGSNLKLIEISQGRTLGSLDFTVPGDLNANPVMLPWDGLNADFSNGTILYLTFQVDEDAPEGFRSIEIECVKSGVYDDNLDDVTFEIMNGGIEVVNYVPGDINGDGIVGTKDVTVLRRYIAGGYEVTYVDEALDVDRDGEITTKDLSTLRRFIVGGYGVELQ